MTALAICWAASALAQFSSLTLSAVPEKTTIAPGEPLAVVVTLSNGTGSAVQTAADFTVQTGTVTATIDGKLYAGKGWGRVRQGLEPASLGAGESRTYELVIHLSVITPGLQEQTASQIALAEPGQHMIAISAAGFGFKEAVSSEFTVTVGEPKDQDIPAWNALKEDLSTLSLLTPGMTNLDEPSSVISLANAHVSSSYGSHLMLAVGRHHQAMERWAEAVTAFSRAKASTSSLVKRLAVLGEVNATVRQGKIAEAKALMASAGPTFAGTVHEELYGQLVEELDSLDGGSP